MKVTIQLPFRIQSGGDGYAEKTFDIPEAPVPFQVIVYVGDEMFKGQLTDLVWDERRGFALPLKEKVLKDVQSPLGTPDVRFWEELNDKTSGWRVYRRPGS
jgi:hypothetical protein